MRLRSTNIPKCYNDLLWKINKCYSTNSNSLVVITVSVIAVWLVKAVYVINNRKCYSIYWVSNCLL